MAQALLTPDADAGVASAAPEAVQVYKEMTGMKSIAPSNVDLLTQCVTDIPLFQEAVKKWLAQGYRSGNVTGMIEWYESLVNGKPLPINKPPRAATSRSGTRRNIVKPHTWEAVRSETEKKAQEEKDRRTKRELVKALRAMEVA